MTLKQETIVELLRETGPMTVADLAITCDVSEATIRRRLEGAEYRGLVTAATSPGGPAIYAAKETDA
jgi:DeoR/GlpR family transcriptional regulator of sugar metabolism